MLFELPCASNCKERCPRGHLRSASYPHDFPKIWQLGGYYIPSLFIGACLGRGACTMAHSLGFIATVHPSIYAMVGAAGMMAGTCRVHVSLVVIMPLGSVVDSSWLGQWKVGQPANSSAGPPPLMYGQLLAKWCWLMLVDCCWPQLFSRPKRGLRGGDNPGTLISSLWAAENVSITET